MILTAKPSITQKEIDYVTDAITRCHGENWDEYIRRFEKAFAEYIGVKYALSTSSCTGALHLSLLACGIGKGDEVIVPDCSWIATATAVVYTGAKPVFCDVHPLTWTIDANRCLDLITSKTKAIIPVHLYGNPCNMDDMDYLRNRCGVRIIEDAAPALGAQWGDDKIGGLGDIGCFSFQGAKLLSTGEGGMFVTDDEELYNKAKYYWNHCRIDGFTIGDIGYKYKMSNLQAAWGLAQIERIDDILAKRRQIYEWYKKGLKDVPVDINIATNPVETPNYWMTSIVLNSDVAREEVQSFLKEKDVDTRPFFPQMSSFKMFELADAPVANYIGKQGINLPSYHDITEDEVGYICYMLKAIILNPTAKR